MAAIEGRASRLILRAVIAGSLVIGGYVVSAWPTEPSALAALEAPDAGRISVIRQPGDGRAGAAFLPASILTVRRRLEHGQWVWQDAGVPQGAVEVEVDLGAQMVRVFRAGHEIGYSLILYGADEKPTPPGTFAVLSKHEEHRSSLYDADMPFTLRLTHDGISIHGSDVRRGSATHGCIGLPTAFAKALFREIKVGEKVRIHA